MDGNKDEGLRCMRMGESAMKSGNKARALKFLNMAKRIYPNPQVDSYLRELEEEEPAAAKNSASERESKFSAGAGNGVHDGKGNKDEGKVNKDEGKGSKDEGGVNKDKGKGNKDEGLRCMKMGENAMKSGDKARALKFLNMAKRIYPNPQVDAFLRELAEGEEPAAAKNSGSERESKFPAGAGNGVHDGKGRTNSVPRSRSVNAEGEANGNEEGRRSGIPRSRSTTSVSDATPEQIEIVRRIRRTKDYYEILGLTKTCSEGEVRKAYRKLSLKVHPDKNSAPGAEESFKAVSKAFQVLSDADLRDKYDRDGPDEDIQHVRHRHSARQYGGAPVYYEDVFDANDIFNSFFFGMQQPNGNFRRAQFVRTQAPHFTQAQRGEAHSINLLSLLQLLPILILLIVSLFPFSQPVFNLMSVAPYQIQRKTAEHEVHYYVKSHNFDKEYPPGSAARRKVEGQVESEYRDILVQNCRMELGMRRWGQSSETPNCDRLKRFDRS